MLCFDCVKSYTIREYNTHKMKCLEEKYKAPLSYSKIPIKVVPKPRRRRTPKVNM